MQTPLIHSLPLPRTNALLALLIVCFCLSGCPTNETPMGASPTELDKPTTPATSAVEGERKAQAKKPKKRSKAKKKKKNKKKKAKRAKAKKKGTAKAGSPTRGPNAASSTKAAHNRPVACSSPPLRGCFVRISAGEFTMGAQSTDPDAPGYDPHAEPHEGPTHSVKLSAYWIQQEEVWTDNFQRCVEAGACDTADLMPPGGTSNYKHPSRSDHPINGINFKGASDYCHWLGARLPTEAEWEYAARGTDGRHYPWGNSKGCGRYPPNAGAFRHQQTVAESKCINQSTTAYADLRNHSAFGIRGMAGNVWEWVADWYAPDYYAKSQSSDPTGPVSGTLRVQRGGGWTNEAPHELGATRRGMMKPSLMLDDVGFRCALDGTKEVEVGLPTEYAQKQVKQGQSKNGGGAQQAAPHTAKRTIAGGIGVSPSPLVFTVAGHKAVVAASATVTNTTQETAEIVSLVYRGYPVMRISKIPKLPHTLEPGAQFTIELTRTPGGAEDGRIVGNVVITTGGTPATETTVQIQEKLAEKK